MLPASARAPRLDLLTSAPFNAGSRLKRASLKDGSGSVGHQGGRSGNDEVARTPQLQPRPSRPAPGEQRLQSPLNTSPRMMPHTSDAAADAILVSEQSAFN